MIKIEDKEKCCGCTACASICPVHCVEMKSDKEGFLYPFVNESLCIGCGKCEKVCPVTHLSEERKPLHCYAAKSKDVEVLIKSSSGGVFSLLANYVIQDKDGLVFGAMWKEEEVVHGMVEYVEDVWMLRGSKYVQSRLGDSFIKIKRALEQGRFVMFVGTPCQVAGLRSFLNRNYHNLLLVDLACHGAPSPKILSRYITEIKEHYCVDKVELDFRDKVTGWCTYSISAYSNARQLFSERATDNIYMKAYLRELISRPLCYKCPFKSFISGSDITISDFWGIEDVYPEMHDDSGTSLVLVHSENGNVVIESISSTLAIRSVAYEQAIKNNDSLLHSEIPHPERAYFFKKIDVKSFTMLADECLRLRRITRLKLLFKSYFGKRRQK